VGPGGHQRGRALVSRAALGAPAAGMTRLHDFFESYYRLRPVNATFTGVHEHDGELPDWSPHGLDVAVDEKRRVRASLVENGIHGPIHDVAVRDRELAVSFLDIQIDESSGRHFQRGNPSLAVGEAVFGVIALMTRPFAPIGTRADAAAARMRAIPSFLDGARRSLSREIPAEWRLKCLRECEGADRIFAGGIARW